MEIKHLGEDVTLVLGDCLEYMQTMQTMEAGSVDAVITDPPYGNNYKARILGKGETRTNKTLYEGEGIKNNMQAPNITELLKFPKVVIWGGNYFTDQLPVSQAWIIWDKRGHPRYYGTTTFADCELAWTNLKFPARMYKQIWNGVVREGEESSKRGYGRVHPNQKPERLFRWIIENNTNPGDTIFDPFMGSGTTGVAAVQLGRRFIGCEIEPKYFEIAEKRIRQAQMQLRLGI